jgi:peptidoglycan/LPS O-acetylase OafA/YrhL
MDAATSVSMIESHNRRESVHLPAYSVHMDAIRALAAFLVLAGHARMLFFGFHEGHAESVAGSAHSVQNTGSLGLGYHAVIVFFVLSGFLVGNSAWRAIRSGQWSWRKYLLQRMTRLWIVLLPALIIGGFLDHAGRRFLSQNDSIYTGPPGQGMVSSNLANVSTVEVLAGNAVFLQTILVPSYGTNGALWSLANEFWYYMAFPPLLLLFLGKRPIWMKVGYVILAAAILTFVGAGIALLFLVWLLGFGVSVLPLGIPARYRQAVTIACLLQFLAVNALIRTHAIRSQTAAGLLGVSFALFLYAIVHARHPVRSMAYQHVATRFAGFSYTLYLVHLPFLTFLTALVITPWHAWPKNPPYLLAAVLLVIAAYTYGWVLYLLFERNTEQVRRWITSFFTRQPDPKTPHTCAPYA